MQLALEDAHRDESVKISLDMSSVADLVDGRLVHVLFFRLAKQTSKQSEGLWKRFTQIFRLRKVKTRAYGNPESFYLFFPFLYLFSVLLLCFIVSYICMISISES